MGPKARAFTERAPGSLMSPLMGSSTQQPHIIRETEQLKKLNLVEKKLYPGLLSSWVTYEATEEHIISD